MHACLQRRKRMRKIKISKKKRESEMALFFLRAYMEEAKLLKKISSDILFKIKKKGGTYYGRVYNTYI